MKRIMICLALGSVFLAGSVFALDVTQTKPLMIIADSEGNVIEGVSASTSEATVLEKVLNLGAGSYTIIRPVWKITIKNSNCDCDASDEDGGISAPK